ncbi:MAG: hypothetical protein L6R19_28545 [Alphaproteobacteria bacterium]|nr:hypothetical protein [Alphaproteobacteria bacterium]
MLRTALAGSASPAAARLTEILDFDARAFPEAARADTAALQRAAARLGIDLAVFTNALALEGKSLFQPGATGAPEERAFAVPRPAPGSILAHSPLSRGEVLKAALTDVALAYPPDSLDMVLITNSHGAGAFALMPRVFTDLSQADPAALLAEFEGRRAPEPPAGTAGRMPEGTTKPDYWRVLAELGARRGVRFPLVFRQACESGVSSWEEFRALPANVGAIAHTAGGRIAYRDIDYAAVLAAAASVDGVTGHIARELRARGIHVDQPKAMWTWLVRDAAVAFWPYLLFVPLALWLAWYGPKLLAAAWRGVSRPARAAGRSPAP